MRLMERVVEQALILVPAAEGALIGLVDPSGPGAEPEGITFVCASGFLQGQLGLRILVDASLSGQALREGRSFLTPDTETDLTVDRAATRTLGIRSSVILPVSCRGDPLGVLSVASSLVGAFSPGDLETLTCLADFVGVVVAAATDLARVTATLLGDVESPVLTPAERFVANVLQPGAVDDLEARTRIETVLDTEAFAMVFQPVFDLHTGDLLAVEALTRFAPMPYRTPDLWFAEAHAVGLGQELELAAIRAALRRLPDLPPRTRMAVNAGPDIILSGALLDLLRTVDPRRVIVELTEHVEIDDYLGLAGALAELRRAGASLAIDDTGSGVSSLAHILRLAPDLIKLDRALTSGIDIDPVRRALAQALLTFAAETGARIVAEGIETAGELDVLRRLGIRLGQGYHLAMPAPMEDLQLSLPLPSPPGTPAPAPVPSPTR